MRGLAAWETVCRCTLLTHRAALPPAGHMALRPTVEPVATGTAIPERGTKGQELGCRREWGWSGGACGWGWVSCV